jgi:sucrose phosphorylase
MDDFISKIARHLQVIYKDQFSEAFVNRVAKLAGSRDASFREWDETDVILITYGNSIINEGKPGLVSLLDFMLSRLSETISCVHILPFFPSTSDDGFAVSDYLRVNPELGDWNDLAAIRQSFTLMGDLVVNHVSSHHLWFQNFLKGCHPGKDFFIEKQPGVNYSQVIRPRSGPLFSEFVSSTGVKHVWTTFSSDQVDLNFSNPEVLFEIIKILVFYLNKGFRIIRLDAIAFIWKQPGTSCLNLPETHEVVKLLRDVAMQVSPGSIVLTETNVPNHENWSYFGRGDEAQMVYQFTLPPLLLHALVAGTSVYLNRWLSELPLLQNDQTFLNHTASHDGIGVRPLEGILPSREISALLETMVSLGGMISYRNTDRGEEPYEINMSYLDAMGRSLQGPDGYIEERFICSQTIMMSLRGIPAFYIHSLLGTRNDPDGVLATGRARSINRKQLHAHEIDRNLSEHTLQGRIFAKLTGLIELRKKCSAFHPNAIQKLLPLNSQVLAFIRYSPTAQEELLCVFNLTSQRVELYDPVFNGNRNDLISGQVWSTLSGYINLTAYQALWLVHENRCRS